MLNLISSVLQQECKQESENLDKGRIRGIAPPPKKLPLPLNGGRSHAFSFLDLGRSVMEVLKPETTYRVGQKSKLLILSEYVNNIQK